ncbi:MAG TPA: hypothetical protein PKE45_00335, partial [Caldilineaceae bacterium]|nr:hypothetical protein [Caldilineaceae bacterium]
GLPPSNPNDPSDGGRDSDGGGASDYDELKNGTDPTDPTDDQASTGNPNGIWLPLIGNRTS